MAVRRPLVLVAGKKKELPVGDVLPLAALAAVVADTLTDGVLDVAPSQNAVVDALAGKFDKAGGALSGGLSFGSTVAASVTNLSRHISLWGDAYGFSVTGARLNYVAPATTIHAFVINGVDIATIASTGLSATALSVGAAPVWHSGNFNPATKASLDATVSFGDVTSLRAAAPTTGYYFFGNTNARYIGWDGANLVAGVDTGQGNIWHTRNFDPDLKANLASPTFTGAVNIINADGTQSHFNHAGTNNNYIRGALLQVDTPLTTFGGPIRLRGYTVATLPAGTQGDTAFVTDATAPTWNAALVGGGAVVCPSFRNATAWVSA